MAVDVFVELSAILFITLVVTLIIRLFKQPAIIGYILSGIIAGPFALDLINATDTLSTFAHKGVALLLFLVGLNMNPKVIKEVGKISLVTGIGQVLFTSIVGFLIAQLLGFSTLTSIYIAIALTFSSTIVIMKLISDKNDLESLYAKISVGFLIVQDFIVIIILLVISSISGGGSLLTVASESLTKGLVSIFILFLITIRILPPFTSLIARSEEMLFLFALTWCFGVATVFHQIGFSFEAGALLAGMSLSVSPYHFEIGSKLRPLRDFFLILFFVMLGSQMVFESLLTQLPSILIFSLFVLIGNPLIVMILMGFFGYRKKTGFNAGLTVAQISEFSLVLIAVGISMNHIPAEMLSFVTAVALITFAGSTYLIMYSDKVYKLLEPFLGIFERRSLLKKETSNGNKAHDIILFGCNRIGYDILDSLKKIKKKFLVIDHDPETIKKLSEKGYDSKFGDAGSTDLLQDLDLSKTKMVISTVSHKETNLLIIDHIRKKNKKTIVSVVSHQIDDALELYENGATYVIMPHLLGARHFSTMINKNKLGVKKFLKDKIAHIEHINKRKRLGHTK